ncbi:mucosa-associated lymphoid tissue lymphoma translocation protein 1-like [Ciona intestinalis]
MHTTSSIRNTILISEVPQEILNRLISYLHNDGESGWRALVYHLQQRDHLFSEDEINSFKTIHAPTLVIEGLKKRNKTVDYLLSFLHLLPCRCAAERFANDLWMLEKSQQKFMSTPMPECSKFSSVGPSYIPNGYSTHAQSNHVFDQTMFSSLNNLNKPSKPYISIIKQPTPQSVKMRDDLMLVCKAEGEPVPVHFQWYKDGCMLPNQNNHVLMIGEMLQEHQGFYYCHLMLRTSPAVEKRTDEVFVSVVLEPSVTPFFATNKLALLIANEHYAHNPRLPATSHDIRALTKIFQEDLGFKTLSFTNLNFTNMMFAFDLFNDLVSSGCYCVFYFGGHGYENDGKCFLVPIDAPPDYQNNDCVPAQSELENMKRRGDPNLMLILLDICRKRNPMNSSSHQSYGSSFADKVVFAYATTESAEAYERYGEKHGIFVDSLRKHLTTPIRVNHMLSDVQDEIKKSDVQISEVKSTLSENRCLTDKIQLDDVKAIKAYKEVDRIWSSLHFTPLPVLLKFEACDAEVTITFTNILTNAVNISVNVIKCGKAVECKPFICTNYFGDLVVSHCSSEFEPQSCQVSNLEHLQEHLPVTVGLRYKFPSEEQWHPLRYTYSIRLPFIKEWNDAKRKRS